MSLESRLLHGIETPDINGCSVLYRYIRPADDLDVLTNLLHDAYAPLAAAGMRFVASHQSVDVTRSRIQKGETIVALDRDQLIGTITLATAVNTGGSPFYDRADVVSVGQFAVTPTRQRCGTGSQLLHLAERRARELGAAFIALDTSEHALHLIRLYERRGYSHVEHVKWAGVNYRSVVLAKPLSVGRVEF